MATKRKPAKHVEPVVEPVVQQKPDNIVIPANVGEISACCDKHSSRYTLEGFRLQVKDDGSYEAAATDSSCLALLRGKRVDVPLREKTTTHRSGIDTSKSFDAIVSPKDWKAAAAASSDKQKMIGVAQANNIITLVCDDKRSIQTRAIEGPFPNAESLIPSTPPVFSVAVNCKRLAKVAAVAGRFCENVTIEFRGADQALVFRGSNVAQEFIGLLMPVVTEFGF